MKYLKIIFLILIVASCKSPVTPKNGVSTELAGSRKSAIDSLQYTLNFSLPENKTDQVSGSNTIRFYLNKKLSEIIIDFKEKPDHIKEVFVDGKKEEWIFQNEHIILKNNSFKKGWNEIHINFIAGDLSLNRQDEIMYTLFVPDRARTCFPCFDQPDLKAVFSLSLDLPENWLACANGKEIENSLQNGRRQMIFSNTKPLPTYLFAFAAGKFQITEEEHKNLTVRMFHRETDSVLLANNRDEIFRQVFSSLDWMEEYTGISYPFAKYDLIAIPSFQYGGMEHNGATLYRSRLLFLPESPTDNQLLSRANLIAHETAHMWFGNLVTMKWFNEVWLKEVFANFIAEKITNPWFPDTDHDLKFLSAHYPASYAIDRSDGANPIQQKLDNLENAGTIYGSIIYHKAPLVMRKLEEITGEELMQQALGEYLDTYSYSNANWDELIYILDNKVEEDLKAWSKVWINETGMPVYIVESIKENELRIQQEDPDNNNRFWPDRLLSNNTEQVYNFGFDKSGKQFIYNDSLPLFMNTDGFTYGSFILEKETSEDYLRNFEDNYLKLTNSCKFSQYIILYENVLNAKLRPETLLNTINRLIPLEENNLVLQYILNVESRLFWQFISPEKRKVHSTMISECLWNEYVNRTGSSKKMFFEQLMIMETKYDGLMKLMEIWKKGRDQEMRLSEYDQLEYSYELCLKLPGKFEEISNFQRERTNNTDRLKSLEFILPSIHPDSSIRNEFFESLKSATNRQIESDVIKALGFLNHPLRLNSELPHLYTYLELLPEIQMTGDIFFPKRWLDAVFGFHNSIEVRNIVDNFLLDYPELPDHLRQKILQSTDLLYRSSSILNPTE